MSREDAVALLAAFRRASEEPPPPDPKRMARRYAEIISQRPLEEEDGEARLEWGW